MSYENKGKGGRVIEWINAIGVFVAILTLVALVITTNKSINAQKELFDRQSRINTAEAAYTRFVDILLPGKNARVAIALFGSEEVFQEFGKLQKAAGHKLESFQDGSEIEEALLDFLSAIRADVLGENYAVDKKAIKEILGIK